MIKQNYILIFILCFIATGLFNCHIGTKEPGRIDTLIISIDFSDPNLRAHVHEYARDYNLKYIDEFTDFVAHSRNIIDLSGMEELVYLEFLSLRNNNICDLTPLKGLLNLYELDLGNNNINDLNSLTHLKELKYLFLYENNISDISPLVGLEKLEQLLLGDNNIYDIKSLEKLNNMNDLRLNYNKISDISSICDLVNLKYLSLAYNNIITGVDTLVSLTNAQSIVLYDNPGIPIAHINALIAALGDYIVYY